MTCWLATKGGAKIITESHFLGDKHYPSGGDAAVNDSSAKMCKAVVNVLGEMGNPEVVDRIAGLQTDPDFGVRRAVEAALTKLKATK